MRVPSFDRFRRLAQAAAIFVCGGIVGSAVYSALTNDVVNHVLIDNIELQEQVDALKKEAEQDQQQRRNVSVVRNIVFYVEASAGKAALDVLTEAQLKKALKEDLAIFIGRSIYDVPSDARLARELLENKTYDHIGGRQYEVRVKTILVAGGVLQVWVEAAVHAGVGT